MNWFLYEGTNNLVRTSLYQDSHVSNHYYQDSKALFFKTRDPFLQLAMPQKCYADFPLYFSLKESGKLRFPDVSLGNKIDLPS